MLHLFVYWSAVLPAMQCREGRIFLSWARRECASFLLAWLRLTSHIPVLITSKQWLPITPNCREDLQQSIISAYFKWEVETFLCQDRELCGFCYKQKWHNIPLCKLRPTTNTQDQILISLKFSLKNKRLIEANDIWWITLRVSVDLNMLIHIWI